ncbi:MAG TPA: hypothetical protein VL986_11355 [Terracidiphilus sp.]|nr:hypothetical protein [Terracidiphilus sp.]
MTNRHGNMTCEEFQAQLPELIGSGKIDANHPHLRDCELCKALLADLETIAEAARQLFPIEDPPPKLWDKIELALKSEEGSIPEDGDEPEEEPGAKPERK